MELFAELKHDTQYDPFPDIPNGEMEERDSINGDDTHEQCFLYAANQLDYQHRLFAFSLVVFGKKARLSVGTEKGWSSPQGSTVRNFKTSLSNSSSSLTN